MIGAHGGSLAMAAHATTRGPSTAAAARAYLRPHHIHDGRVVTGHGRAMVIWDLHAVITWGWACDGRWGWPCDGHLGWACDGRWDGHAVGERYGPPEL